MFKFDFGTASASGITRRSSTSAPVGLRWSQALIALLIGAAGAAEGAGSTTPFFYDLLSPQLRLDSNLSKATGLTIFEQSRKIASPLTFPMAPFVEPPIQDVASNEVATSERQSDSEVRLFDSVTVLFDAAEETGIHEVLAGPLSEITARGATVTASCSDAACGDTQRWSERFKLYGSGSNEQQAYHRLAISASSTGEQQFVSDIFEIYATRLGCCVRLAVSHHKPNANQYQIQENGSLDPLAFASKPFSVYFKHGEDRFPTSRTHAFAEQIESLRSCSRSRPILLEGHSDSTGSRAANRALSERRLAAVQAALLAAGIPEECLLTAAYGDASPDSASAAEQRKVVVRMLSSGWNGIAAVPPLTVPEAQTGQQRNPPGAPL